MNSLSLKKFWIKTCSLRIEPFVGPAIFLLSLFVFTLRPIGGLDFRESFFHVAQNPFHPYENVYFINPPWIALLILPFRFFSADAGVAINSSLSVTVITLIILKRKGDPISVMLALTSWPFLALVANNNIEWLPGLAFLVQSPWSVPLLLAKPQSGILVILDWFPGKRMVPVILVCAATILLSFIVWGNWPVELLANLRVIRSADYGLDDWNFSPFPYLIPVGIGLIYYVVRHRPRDGEIWSALAAACLVPYFAIHSMAITYALICARNKKIAFVVWILLWGYLLASYWMFLR